MGDGKTYGFFVVWTQSCLDFPAQGINKLPFMLTLV